MKRQQTQTSGHNRTDLASFTYRGETYNLVPCTLADIPSHIEKVLPYWKEEELERQTDYMKQCIMKGHALKLRHTSKSDVLWIYFIPAGKTSICAVYCCWFENKRFLAMLEHYLLYHTTIEKLYFQPHGDKLPFKFLFTDQQQMAWYHHPASVSVNVRGSHCIKLYKREFMKHQIIAH